GRVDRSHEQIGPQERSNVEIAWQEPTVVVGPVLEHLVGGVGLHEQREAAVESGRQNQVGASIVALTSGEHARVSDLAEHHVVAVTVYRIARNDYPVDPVRHEAFARAEI